MIPGGAEQGMMQIYLRVRPFTKEELCCNENQVSNIIIIFFFTFVHLQ